MTRFTLPFTIFVLSCFTGCVALGPLTVARDRFDYAAAISESWKSQTLLNLVKIRYADAPVFLDVTSIINQYEAVNPAKVGTKAAAHYVLDVPGVERGQHGSEEPLTVL